MTDRPETTSINLLQGNDKKDVDDIFVVETKGVGLRLSERVYVDGAKNKLGRMLMSHMLAWDVNDLHAMAAAVGLKRDWFQPATFKNGRYVPPHYDICQANRKAAIGLGAWPIGRKALVAFMREKRRIYHNGLKEIFEANSDGRSASW